MSMKKIFTFILLLIVAAPTFYFGWTQIRVNNNNIGIIQSKMKGLRSEIVYPGRFSWHWDFLIPNNAQLITFETKPYYVIKSISGQYQFDDSSNTMKYYFDYNICLTYTPEAIYNMMKENIITNNEDLQKYLDIAATSICQNATAYYLSKAAKDPFFNPHSIKREELVKAINPYKDFPDLDLTIITLSDFKMPGFNRFRNTNSLDE